MSETGDYCRAQFESDLNALGTIPQGPYSALHELMKDNPDYVLVTDAGISNGIALLSGSARYELPGAATYSFDRLPPTYSRTEDGLQIRAGGVPVTAYN